MQQESLGVNTRLCLKCGWEGPAEDKRCLRCRKQTTTRGTIRVTGVLLMVMGGFLVAVIGVIWIATINMIQNSNNPNATSRFTGSHEQIMAMFTIFGVVMSIGVAAFLAGLWQLIFGRRSLVLIYIMLMLGVIFMIAATVIPAIF